MEGNTLDLNSVSLLNRNIIISDFINNLSANGYLKLPNGLIIEWGIFSAAGVITFPIAFPHNSLSIVIGGSSSALSYYNSAGSSNFTIVGGTTGTYIAIGY